MKLKKLTSAILALTMTVISIPYVTAEEYLLVADLMKTAGAVAEVKAGEESSAKDFEYEVNEDGESVTITWYRGNGGDVVIPSEIDGKKVTVIGAKAFSDCTSLTSVEISVSVTVIEEYAFSDCSSLTSVEIPESVTMIDNYAFWRCSSLTSMEIPNSVTVIGYAAFADCSSLTSVKIPNSVTLLAGCAFSGCTSLKSVELSDNVTTIQFAAFSRCISLTSVEIPNSVTEIVGWAFSECTSLTFVEIPVGVTGIGRQAFCGCTSLTSVIIPDSVTYIDWDTFWGCPSLIIYCNENSYAQTCAEQDGIPFKIIGKEAAIDHDNGIIIENPNLEGKTLEVDKSAESSEDKIIYNITLKDKDGKEIQPEGEVTVKIPLPEGWDAEKTTVSRRESDCKLTDMKAAYENGYLVFVTDHFSEYVLSIKEPVTFKLGDPNDDGKITTVDAKWVLQAVSGSRTLTPEQEAAADVNGDGKITTVDAKWILQAVSGSRVF